MGRTTEADAVLEIIKKVDEVCKSRGKRYDDRMIKHYITMGRIIKYWPAQLFIFFEESKIYAYKRIPLLLNTIFSSQNVDEENIENKNKSIEILIEEYSESKKYRPINKTEISKIKKDLVKYINKNKERNVKLCGQRLNELIYEKTKLKEELQNDNDKIKNVVICCKDEDIDYVWEWIYWKEKKFFGGDKFFWGDKFNIVRIPKDGIPDRELKNSTFQINTVTILKDNCHVAWNICENMCNKLNSIVNCEEKSLDISTLSSLRISDCIHIGAWRKTFDGENLTTICQTFSQRKPIFLFLNIFSNEPSSTFGDASKLINPCPATTWIDSSFNIPEESEESKKVAKLFVNCFYDEVIEELSNRGANIVEIVAKIRKNEKIKDNLWRFVYVVHGNPCTILTHA